MLEEARLPLPAALLPQHVRTADRDEDLDPEVLFGRLSVRAEEAGPTTTFALLPLGVSEGALLVAVPHSCWNKAIARRCLPRQALGRAVNLEVSAEGESPGEPHPALKIKVWRGFLDSTPEASWTPGPLDLLRASQDQFGIDFDTARSEEGGAPAHAEDPVAELAVEGALSSLQRAKPNPLSESDGEGQPSGHPEAMPGDLPPLERAVL